MSKQQQPIDRRAPLDVDTTRTMRALAPEELHDSARPTWYAIQLVVSDRPVNLDMMPRLEVFAAHRLYAIAAKQANCTWHALRLGFFPTEQAAEVVCGYLRTFFSSPSTVRVSAAEQARFAQPAAPGASAQKVAANTAAAPVAGARDARRPLAPDASPSIKPNTMHVPSKRTKTLAEELLAEAREVQLSRSGKQRASEPSRSWLARLFAPNERPRSLRKA